MVVQVTTLTVLDDDKVIEADTALDHFGSPGHVPQANSIPQKYSPPIFEAANCILDMHSGLTKLFIIFHFTGILGGLTEWCRKKWMISCIATVSKQSPHSSMESISPRWACGTSLMSWKQRSHDGIQEMMTCSSTQDPRLQPIACSLWRGFLCDCEMDLWTFLVGCHQYVFHLKKK